MSTSVYVSTSCHQGNRKYMEDCYETKLTKSHHKPNLISGIYLGIFDGHGGFQAAQYAKEHLLTEISSQNGFWSKESSKVLNAIKTGFIATHLKICQSVGRNNGNHFKSIPKAPY